MKESTKKAIDWATKLAAAADMELTPAGFKYHSERLWIAATVTEDLLLLTVPADGKDPSLRVARNEYLEKFIDSTTPDSVDGPKPKKKPKKKEKQE